MGNGYWVMGNGPNFLHLLLCKHLSPGFIFAITQSWLLGKSQFAFRFSLFAKHVSG